MDELNSVASDSVDKANELVGVLIQYGSAFGLKVVFAVLFWIVGRWMISFIVRFVQRSMTRQRIDPTVLRYVGFFITVTLNIILVIAILGYCGIETTSFAAILAAVGLAIGMAWSGLLANLAAGGFIIVLRPFKVGDEIGAGGVVGTVTEIGLFVTTVNTADNVLTLVGNNKIFSDTIQNFSSNDFRRVELSLALPFATDERVVVGLLQQRLGRVANVLSAPAVDIRVKDVSSESLVLMVRLCCHSEHYRSVYFDANGVIREVLKNMADHQVQIDVVSGEFAESRPGSGGVDREVG
ncbi:Small-conductance mechanosensitive channel [Pseudomonas fluorescens]|uniref:Small-conductance mechanosensitive channel n=1 Tax=Pseudomonas fluorescens TaxID=294 RepID=A0A5E7I3W7_PSEFL|nr:mechanosensitive ion channel family protein [Pseudomonas fluorescens]VVO71118.1 Small-conductance mechanosensitive channel [Pseudomonas fluorescens]